MASDRNSPSGAQEMGAGHEGSLEAMMAEARRQGWLRDDQLPLVEELVDMYQQAADYFLEAIAKADRTMVETLVRQTSRYLFAKGVEGVILWGLSTDGDISVSFHPKHLAGHLETEVPAHLHQTVVDSMSVGEALFRAHQQFVLGAQSAGRAVDMQSEIRTTLEWMPRFGIGYALVHKLHLIVEPGTQDTVFADQPVSEEQPHSRDQTAQSTPAVRTGSPRHEQYIECERLSSESGELVACGELTKLLEGETEPGQQNHLRDIGDRYWRRGHKLLAAACYRRSLQLQPEAPTYLNLAVCLDDLAAELTGDAAAAVGAQESYRAQSVAALRMFHRLARTEQERESANEMLRQKGKGHLIEQAVAVLDEHRSPELPAKSLAQSQAPTSVVGRARPPRRFWLAAGAALVLALLGAAFVLLGGGQYLRVLLARLTDPILPTGTVVPTQTPAHGGTASEYFESGAARAAGGDHAGAIADFTEAILLYTTDAEKASAYNSRAIARAALGDYLTAIADYTEAIQLSATDAERVVYYGNRGMARAANGDSDGAIADYDEAILLAPADANAATAYHGRGIERDANGDRAGAISDYTDAIRLYVDGPDKANTLGLRGIALQAEGNYAASITDFTQVIRLRPDDRQTAAAYHYRGIARAEEGDGGGAIADFTEAIQLHPADADKAYAYGARGAARAEQGDNEGAITDYTEAIRLSATDADRALAYQSRGFAREAASDYPGAIADYTEAIQLHPADADKAYAYGGRGAARAEQGDNEGAIADYTEAIRLSATDADRAWAYQSRAFARQAAGDYPGSIADLTEAIRLYPVDSDKAYAYGGRGAARAEQGDNEGAIADLTEAIRLSATDADRAWAYQSRAFARQAAGDYPGAIADCTEAIRLSPTDAERASAHFWRGATLADAGDHTGAIADFDETIRLSPDDAGRADAYAARGIARFTTGDNTGAIVDLTDAIRYLPEGAVKANSLLWRGIVLAAEGDSSSAFNDYKGAVEMLPTDDLDSLPTDSEKAWAFGVRGLARARLGQSEQSVADIREAIRLSSSAKDKGNAHYNMACVRALLGATQAACDSLATALELDPTSRVWARWDPDLESIRNEPCFRVLTADPPGDTP